MYIRASNIHIFNDLHYFGSRYFTYFGSNKYGSHFNLKAYDIEITVNPHSEYHGVHKSNPVNDGWKSLSGLLSEKGIK